ncbi:alanine/glycine:cation symporter family protein [Schaalia sp. lx-100]|uniref:alanine/glycine:cation symporter family protein n=1 Tax=Schaalia sp. lx-100 TaxID=2899081 RepID=UPI001E608846|nr:alanine/glycine:cation symporter family protein [Schaalia sp. lx-100]MCD4557087.1 alanine:cation symporter family protein [Schaalia sp. lx-100]
MIVSTETLSLWDTLAAQILTVADWLTLHVTLWVLVGTGLFLTIASRALQIRYFPDMLRTVVGSRQDAHGGISSFQAFTISLAARVGVGNVFGVAAALLMGGPGAIFWMWVVALVGMATAFFEATLAQIFKVRAADASFRGGPAYYIALGMKNKVLAVIFAIITVVTCAFVITSVQSNAIAGTLLSVLGENGSTPIAALGGLTAAQIVIAALLFVFSSMVIFGGIRAVARVTEWMAPIMSLIYVVMVAVIVIINIGDFGRVIYEIIREAFAPAPIAGGLGGGIFAAIINGTKRGLFSNEAGQGTAPNAAATATVNHPVQQGLLQSLGVFVDTIIVCTATAFVILIAGPQVWGAEGVNPANLTTLAVSHELGQWAVMPMAVLIFVLAYSSIIAAYVYSETNMSFVTSSRIAVWVVRVISVGSVVIGALATLDLVWNTVDIAMAVMTVANLVALLVLSKWGFGVMRDYDAQKRAGVASPIFISTGNKFLPGELPTDVWERAPEEQQTSAPRQ